MGRRMRAGAVITLGTVVLAGCTGGSTGGTYGTGGTIDSQDARANPGVPAPTQTSAPATVPGSASQSSRQSPALVAGEAKIRTAQLTVTVSDAKAVNARADGAVDLAERVGGEVESDDRSSGRYATATLRLRVPPAELESALRTLSSFGKPASREASSRDVTGQVADVKSRVESAQRAIARLRVLYDGAARVSDVIAIEQELSTREADLESLQAQQRALAGQTSLATITLVLRASPAAAKPVADDRSGFLGGLSRGWDAFTSFFAGLATGVGAVLPFLALLAVLGLVLRAAVARIRRRRPAPQPATE